MTINLNRMQEKLDNTLAKETPESLSKWLEEKEIEKVMNDKAVTNISGWTLGDSATSEENEEEYRERLAKNGPIFHQKINEALSEISKKK